MKSFIFFTKIIGNVQMNYFAHIKLTYVGCASDCALFQYLKLQSPICIIGKFPCCRKQRIRRMVNSIVKLEKNNWSRFNEPCCKKCVVGKSIHIVYAQGNVPKYFWYTVWVTNREYIVVSLMTTKYVWNRIITRQGCIYYKL